MRVRSRRERRAGLLERLLDPLPPALAIIVLIAVLGGMGVVGAAVIAIAVVNGYPDTEFDKAFAVARAGVATFIGGLAFATLAWALAGRTEPAHRTALPVTAFAGGLVATGFDVRDSFFELAAQVIPVLLLTLLVERRTSVVSGHQNERQRGAAVIAVLALGVGEGCALAATANEAVDAYVFGIVSGALLAGFIAVTAGAFMERDESSPP